jgi:hypothetical protein
MKLLIMQFSPPSYHFIPLRTKYSPLHPVLKTPSVYVPPLLNTRIIINKLKSVEGFEILITLLRSASFGMCLYVGVKISKEHSSTLMKETAGPSGTFVSTY